MKALILARVSTENQQLESQIEKLKDEANRLGYKDEDITIISGKESGVKLDIEERQTIQQMKEHIDTGLYNMVLIWEVSRLARRPKVLYEVREYLIERHVNLRCLTPNFTMLKEDFTIDPTASIVFALFGTMAEEEARLSKERMSRGKKHKQALGGYIGGKPLFGYKFENDKLVVDYSKSEIIKKIYNMYERGLSTRSIAIELMETGELKQSILNNANRQVQMILSRPEYYGGKSDISGYNYPKIISKTQFDKCREVAKDKTKEHTRIKKICLCKKLLYCKQNGYLLSPNIAKGQYKLYTIDKSINMTMRIDLMDKLIWDVIVEHVRTLKEDDDVKTRLEEESKVLLRKVQQSMRNIIDIRKQIDRIESRIIEGKMSEIKGDRMIEEKTIELKEQEELMDNCNYLYGQKMEMIEEGTYKKNIENIEDDVERQNIVRKYVEKILLEKTGQKRGHYNIEIIMTDGKVYNYLFWSSGPWNNIERI